MANRFNISIKRTYTDKNGIEKTAWRQIGVAFENEKGVYGTIEMVPTGNWDGRFSLFPADDAPAAPKSAPSQASDDYPF